MLEGARKTTRMVTEYEIDPDRKVIATAQTGEQIRVRVVIVESFDNGDTDISVKGNSITKDGRDKSRGSYFFADNATVDAVREELSR